MYLPKLLGLTCVLILFFCVGCQNDCHFLNSGKVIDGKFIQDELEWSMSLPEGIEVIDTSEYLRVARLGLEYASGTQNSCAQNLGRWELPGERYRAQCYVNADPLSMYPPNFEMISMMRDVYERMCVTEEMECSDSMYVTTISDLHWDVLYYSFTTDKTLHSFIYETHYKNRLLTVYIVGTDYPAVLNWCRLFEASSFGEENIVAFQQRDTTGS